MAPGGKGRMAMTIRQPVGIIGSITPFNLPLNLALHKVGGPRWRAAMRCP